MLCKRLVHRLVILSGLLTLSTVLRRRRLSHADTQNCMYTEAASPTMHDDAQSEAGQKSKRLKPSKTPRGDSSGPSVRACGLVIDDAQSKAG